MIYFSVCSREGKQPKSLDKLIKYCNSDEAFRISVTYDASSIYDGHKQNIRLFKRWMALEDSDIIVLCHDDVDIISNQKEVLQLLSVARKPGVGFVGLAGACQLPPDGAWWNARAVGDTRGFVFQGIDATTMYPNYFGKSGQVIVLDGCFLALTYSTLKTIGLEEPDYLETGWDFYDIHLTYKAHLKGFANYTVPIIVMHESAGIMREGWFAAKDKFLSNHAATLPHAKLTVNKTHGLPK
tara:strand:+ start:1040 stop:1759 length:720 start_codon:yes stop_codon:yes gene_type:complete